MNADMQMIDGRRLIWHSPAPMPSSTERNANGQAEHPIAEQLQEVATELRAMRDVFDEIRQQLHWLATNGIPWWEPALEERRRPAPISVTVIREDAKFPDANSPDADLIRAAVERLETHLASIATDQLALFVDALDDAQDQFVAALKGDPQHSLKFDDPPDDGPVPPRPVLATGNDNPKPAADAKPPVNDSAAVSSQNAQHVKGLTPSTVSDRSARKPAATSHQRTFFDAPAPSEIAPFEIGDAVTFRWEGTELFGEVAALDDATNQATVMLIPSWEPVTVYQDELTKTDTDPMTAETQADPTQPGQSG